MSKTSKQLERHFKGIANHWRIDILFLVNQHKDLAVDDIAKNLSANFKTISEHTKKLVTAGLLNKKYQGRYVVHSLSPYGKHMVSILHKFKNIA